MAVVDLTTGENFWEADTDEASSVQADTADARDVQADKGDAGDVQFDLKACMNSGRPITVEWDRSQKDFTDGFGLCSPARWRPSQRGVRRSDVMLKLANDTFEIFAEAVVASSQSSGNT